MLWFLQVIIEWIITWYILHLHIVNFKNKISRFILIDYYLPIRSSVQNLIQCFLLLSSLPLLMRIHSWSVRILFLACWKLRVVKLKTIFRNFKNSWTSFSRGSLVIYVSMWTHSSTWRPSTHFVFYIQLFYSIYWS